jgi:hypothetical protein
MLHGIRSIRPPALGELRRGPGLAALPEPLERVADAEVTRKKGVRVAQRTHRYVLDRPRPDPGQRQQTAACLRAIRAGVDRQLLACDGADQPEQRAPTCGGHCQLRRVYLGEHLSRREDMCDGAERTLELLAMRGRQTASQRGGAPNRDLLAEHGADAQLMTIDGAGHASSGRAAHELPDERVVGENLCDAVRVGVEVEQRT